MSVHVVPGIVCSFIGLVSGCWLNVLVQRTPIRVRVIGGPKLHCDNCGTVLQGIQRISLIANVTSKRFCKCCGRRVWKLSPMVEITSAAMVGILGFRFGWSWALPAFMVAFFGFAGIAITDLRMKIVPNRMLYPTLFSALALMLFDALVESSMAKLTTALVCMCALWCFYYVVWFAYPKGMGFGDVRLAALVGLTTGWLGIGSTFVALMLGLLSGAATGLFFLTIRVLSRKDPIPFGPFMIFGAAASILFGHEIAAWWLNQQT